MNGNPAHPTTQQGSGKAKTFITWLTGILLVLPALLNSGIDVYNSVMSIPTGNVEKLNERKRSEHFQHEPLFSQNFEIPAEHGSKKQLKLFVYPNADIYVNYSGFEQWLPAEESLSEDSSVSLLMLSPAIAGAVKDFGYPKVIISPAEIRRGVDLKSLETKKLEESQVLSQVITRSYWFEKQNSDHAGFSETSKVYTETFNAIDGYKITSFKVETASISNANITSTNLSSDGLQIQVVFEIRSGSVLNRWKGWIKAQVITEQVKIN